MHIFMEFEISSKQQIIFFCATLISESSIIMHRVTIVCLGRRSNRLPHGSQCLSTLLHRYAAYCGMSTSGVERTFSAMDQIVGKYRNSLKVSAPEAQLTVCQAFSARKWKQNILTLIYHHDHHSMSIDFRKQLVVDLKLFCESKTMPECDLLKAAQKVHVCAICF